MRRVAGLLIVVLSFVVPIQAFAAHVKGGYIQYKYNGAGSSSGSSNYTITVTVFFSCTVQGPRGSVYLGIFNASTNALVASRSLSTTTSTTVSKQYFSPCMSDPPSICYEIYTYVYTVDLANLAAGYILAVQDAYRTDGIINVTNSGSDGITINANIPGTIDGTDYHTNSSPSFTFLDTAIICYNGHFSYPFSATDAVDGDSLSYEFGNGLNVSNASGQTSQNAPGSPPYYSLAYVSGYSGSTPLGSGVTIDATTGLISGTAPATTGEYVVAVYVKEWRKGVLIDSIKKELQVYVYSCSLTAASLNAGYVNCDNYTFTFQNESTASTVTSYLWNFGVAGATSTAATPSYTYADTGTYTLTLTVSNSTGCTDTTSAPVRVYPGFTPAFSTSGVCYQSPVQFTDNTYAKYGTVDSWAWTFGESTSATNSSTLQDPTHQYAAAGTYTATLTVGTSKGCSGNVSQPVTVYGQPDFTLPFTDTLICTIDTLQLKAISNSSGITYSWSPNYNIMYTATDTPLVWPKDTTVYTVTATQNGCTGTGTITVNTLDYITVTLTPDTTICKTDSITLTPVSYGLQYAWSPATGLSNARIKYPKASPTTNTTYSLVVNLGKCSASGSEYIKVVPYPIAQAGDDTTICYGSIIQLQGSMTGAYYTWTPAILSATRTLTPFVSPLATTDYILTVTDTLGCPKPVSDSALVTVIPEVIVDPGNDTAVVIGEPLQLHATSTDSALVSFAWDPADWLSDAAIADPVATITSSSVDSVIYQVTAATPQGCSGSGKIRVLVYKTLPEIFMPNAFSPNGDGKNDVYRPILVGISSLDYFRIFNRWGQEVFATTQNGKGWDGMLGGHREEAGAFVYMVQGKDYLGKTHTKKGTFILVR